MYIQQQGNNQHSLKTLSRCRDRCRECLQLWEMRTGEVSSYMYEAYTLYSCGSEILDPRHPANQ